MSDWPPREPTEPPSDAEPPAPLWQSPPREPEPVAAAEPVEPVEPVAEVEPVEPPAAELTEPTDWFDPPPVEPVVTPDAPTLPDDYMPPTNDGTGFVSAHTGAVRPADSGEQIAFDVTDLAPNDRRALSLRLTQVGVEHHFDGPATLVGRVEDGSHIQGVMADFAPLEEPPAPYVDAEEIEEVIDEADDEEDEIVFDLAALSSEERRHLTMRLTGAGISHIWEVATDLVVSVADAPVIESYIEEVRNPDGFADDELASFEEDGEVDDEAIYAAMSNLYVAADKLMQRPDDDATAGEFYLAADDVEGLPAPFGFDPRVWTQVLALTDSITGALDAESEPDAIGDNAKTLRQILVNYV